jgi:hypothetical protein
MHKYFPHTEDCLRYGDSTDCPACKFIESKEKEAERKEIQEHRRYRHAIAGRKF